MAEKALTRPPIRPPKRKARVLHEADVLNTVSQAVQGTTKKQIRAVLKATFQALAEALARGESVAYTGFGKFYPTTLKARTGRDPRTGEAIRLPARTVPRFRPGKVLKDLVAGT